MNLRSSPSSDNSNKISLKRGLFITTEQLDAYERMWHKEIHEATYQHLPEKVWR